MYPTLNDGQSVVSFNWAYLGKKPKIGDVVVLKQGDKEIIKRVQNIQDEHIFVVGDNSQESTDSRHFGVVNVNQIVGKVIYQSNDISCPRCSFAVVGIYGRKDAICSNCGFKLTCCGEP